MLTLDEEKLKVLLLNRKSHLERSKLDGVSEIISSISLIVTLALGDFSVISFMDPSLFQLVAWVIAFAILLLGAIQLIRNNWRRFSVENLYNEIADLDPCTEHGFCIAIIRNPNRGGQMSSNLCEKTIKYFTRQVRRPRRTRSRRSDNPKSREDNY